MVVALVLILLAVCIYFYFRSKKIINESISCDEGDFKICGCKDRFTIKKGSRFEFLVVDGQIVSCVDNSVSNVAVEYGGSDHDLS